MPILHEQSNQADYNVSTVELLTPTGNRSGVFANQRDDNGAILGTCTERYKLFQNADLFGRAEESIQKAGLSNYEREYIVSEQGKRARAQFTFKDETITINNRQKGDVLGLRLIVQNSFDRSLRASFVLGLVRLVCTNGMTSVDSEFCMTRKHMGAPKLSFVDQALAQALEAFDPAKIGAVYDLMADVDLKQDEGLTILQNLVNKKTISERTREGIAQVWNAPTFGEDGDRNLYTLYNASTQFLTREVADKRWEMADKVDRNILHTFAQASRAPEKLGKLLTVPKVDASITITE